MIGFYWQLITSTSMTMKGGMMVVGSHGSGNGASTGSEGEVGGS